MKTNVHVILNLEIETEKIHECIAEISRNIKQSDLISENGCITGGEVKTYIFSDSSGNFYEGKEEKVIK